MTNSQFSDINRRCAKDDIAKSQKISIYILKLKPKESDCSENSRTIEVSKRQSHADHATRAFGQNTGAEGLIHFPKKRHLIKVHYINIILDSLCLCFSIHYKKSCMQKYVFFFIYILYSQSFCCCCWFFWFVKNSIWVLC